MAATPVTPSTPGIQPSLGSTKPLGKLLREMPTDKIDTLGDSNEVPKDRIGVTKSERYSITYPPTWSLKPKFMGTDTMALSVLEGEGDLFKENINVVVERIRIGSRKAYSEANLKTMKNQMKGFKIISISEIKLQSGIQATNLVYLHRMSGAASKNRAVFIYEKGVGYVITASAIESTFNRYNLDFEKVVQSFRLN